jgi:hypothetical protein
LEDEEMKNQGTLAKMAALAITGCVLRYTPLATAQSRSRFESGQRLCALV